MFSTDRVCPDGRIEWGQGYLNWLGRIQDRLDLNNQKPSGIGPRTLQRICLDSTKPDFLDEIKLKLGDRWTDGSLTWERVVRLVKDALGINRLSVIEALSSLR